MLPEILVMGWQVIPATDDADLLISQTAVSVAADNMTVVVANDTAVLILQHVDLSTLKYGTFQLQELLLV